VSEKFTPAEARVAFGRFDCTDAPPGSRPRAVARPTACGTTLRLTPDSGCLAVASISGRGLMFKSRLLNFARADHCVLRQNGKHQFAASHALKLFRSNAVYTLIPKNACSTMRLSLAIANCCIPDASHVGWIHDNNDTFQASLEDLILARYTFVILRDPFARLASCFLDKIASKAFPAQRLQELAETMPEPDDVCFADFVESLDDATVLAGNMHWRPQTDFLVYDRYDDYFSVENFGEATAALSDRAGLEIVDARALTSHGLDHYDLLPACLDHSRTPVRELARLQRDGRCPDPRSLYTKPLADRVAQLYAADMKLYADAIGPSMFFRTKENDGHNHRAGAVVNRSSKPGPCWHLPLSRSVIDQICHQIAARRRLADTNRESL
jgi:hypothetical protein